MLFTHIFSWILYSSICCQVLKKHVVLAKGPVIKQGSSSLPCLSSHMCSFFFLTQVIYVSSMFMLLHWVLFICAWLGQLPSPKCPTIYIPTIQLIQRIAEQITRPNHHPGTLHQKNPGKKINTCSTHRNLKPATSSRHATSPHHWVTTLRTTAFSPKRLAKYECRPWLF